VKGWSINFSDEKRADCEVDRGQPPLFYTEMGEPIFEVFFYDDETSRWFCMARSPDAHHREPGVIYFDPSLPGWKNRLREVMRALGSSA
jgi:hypothetical protein